MGHALIPIAVITGPKTETDSLSPSFNTHFKQPELASSSADLVGSLLGRIRTSFEEQNSSYRHLWLLYSQGKLVMVVTAIYFLYDRVC